jgi:DNA-binding NarL/FixJ family response regulator
MDEIRVVLGNQSKLLRDLLRRSIQKIERVKIVGETQRVEMLPALVKDKRADWVILSLPQDESIPEAFHDLAALEEELSLMAISNAGDKVIIRRIEVQEESYQKFCLEDLGAVLRGEEPVPERIS